MATSLRILLLLLIAILFITLLRSFLISTTSSLIFIRSSVLKIKMRHQRSIGPSSRLKKDLIVHIQNYYGTNGYDKIEGANSYMILFVCFFNFLRPHSSLGFKTPITGLFDNNILMTDQWLKLIEILHQYHPANTVN